MEEEVKDNKTESIEDLLTSDYDDKKNQKKRKKEEKKQKRNAKKDKTKEENKKSKKKFIIIFSIILGFIILVIALFLIFVPKIKLNGKEHMVIEYGDHYEEPGCHATYLGRDISDKVWYEGIVNEERIGTYIVKCKVRKNRLTVSKNRKVSIVDTVKPTIELVGDLNKTICPSATYEEEGYTANDNYDGEITDKVNREDKETEILYTVTDTSGNTETITRTIVKEDKTVPEITLKGNATVYVTVGNKYNEPGFTATDNCDEDLTESVKTEGSVDTNNTGTYTLKYSVSDSSGNVGTKERKVVVQKAAQKIGSSLGCGKAGTIYLTFDDGPNGNYTPTILNVLKKYGVKATFFVTAAGSDSLIKREYDEGHAVAVHTWTHEYSQIYASSEAFWSDFNKVQARIKRITGQETKLMRFPGGSSNTVSKVGMSVLANEAIAKGYNYVDWNISSGDAGGTTDPNVECNNVLGSLSKSRGNVVLMHDIKKHTMNAIECIVKGGLDRGYSFAVLDSSVICRHATKR